VASKTYKRGFLTMFSRNSIYLGVSLAGGCETEMLSSMGERLEYRGKRDNCEATAAHLLAFHLIRFMQNVAPFRNSWKN